MRFKEFMEGVVGELQGALEALSDRLMEEQQRNRKKGRAGGPGLQSAK